MLAILFSFILPQIVNIGSVYNDLFEQANDILENINIKYVGGYTVYFILGWYFNNYELKNKEKLYFAGIASIIITIVITAILSVSTGRLMEQMYDSISINILLYTLMVYVFIRDIYKNKKYQENKLILNVANNSFGIYAIHPMIIAAIFKLLTNIEKVDVALVNIPIVYVSTLAISFALSFVLRRIRFFKNLI